MSSVQSEQLLINLIEGSSQEQSQAIQPIEVKDFELESFKDDKVTPVPKDISLDNSKSQIKKARTSNKSQYQTDSHKELFKKNIPGLRRDSEKIHLRVKQTMKQTK